MTFEHYFGIGVAAILALGIAAYLIWGMFTFAVDFWKEQLERPKRGGSWSPAHIARQVSGASLWVLFAAAVLICLAALAGYGISGLFGWG